MNELWGHVIGVFIVVLMLTFIGIWVWAWLPHHRRTFGWMARLPMEDEAAGPGKSIPTTDEEHRR